MQPRTANTTGAGAGGSRRQQTAGGGQGVWAARGSTYLRRGAQPTLDVNWPAQGPGREGQRQGPQLPLRPQRAAGVLGLACDCRRDHGQLSAPSRGPLPLVSPSRVPLLRSGTPCGAQINCWRQARRKIAEQTLSARKSSPPPPCRRDGASGACSGAHACAPAACIGALANAQMA